MAVLKLSQIAAAGVAPAVTDQVLFVTGGTTDNLVTVTQLAAGLPVFTSTARGSVPASGGVATTFLNGAGAFTTPAATVPGGANTQLQFNNAGAFGGTVGYTWDSTNQAATLASIANPAASTLTLTGGTGLTTSQPVLNMTQTWNAAVTFTGFKFNVTNTSSNAASLLFDFQLNTASLLNLREDGTLFLGGSLGQIVLGPANKIFSNGAGVTVNLLSTVGGTNAWLSQATYIGVAQDNGGLVMGAANDTFLVRDAANIYAQRNSTTAQGKRVYNTFTDTSNFERAAFDWTTTANTLTIGTQNLGTGSARGINIVTAGTNAITISSAQLVALPAITTDATHTDSTLCQDTTTHAVYFGSGAAGICLGTSSVRYKHNITDLDDGLSQILALRPITYRYNHQPDQDLYGFTAEDVVDVIPRLVRPDKQGRPNSVDHIGMLAVIVNAIKEQQIMIDELKDQLDELSAGKR